GATPGRSHAPRESDARACYHTHHESPPAITRPSERGAGPAPFGEQVMIDVVGIIMHVVLGWAPAAPSPAPSPATPQIASIVPLAGAPGAVDTSKPGVVLDQVQKFYGSIKQVTAQFRQSVTNDMLGSTKTSDGTVWIMKPGKMRWDYLEKKKDKV